MMKQTPEQWEAMVRRLNQGGCPVLSDHGYKIDPVGLAIEKIPGTSFSSIFDLKQGGTGYAIELTLRNGPARPIDIVGYQIKTPWGVPALSLLPAPKKSSERYPHYYFPEPGPYYEGEWVINRYFARRKNRLQPCQGVEGVLVASSEEPIPCDIAHLARVILTLRIFDSRGNTFSAKFRVPVDRRARIAHEKMKRTMASSEPSGAPEVTPEDTRSQHVETQVATVTEGHDGTEFKKQTSEA
jgi:hypothetical protein